MPNAALPLADFAAALRPRIAGDLRLDAMSRALYATDASMYQIEPVGVLLPRHVDDIQAAVEEAARFGIPVLPRGSGSSLAGSAVGAALVIDTSLHLDGIGPVDAEARTVTVQPGVVLDTLNAHLAPYGLEFGPDPASSNRATLGGMLGTNATGTHSIRYGSVVDHVRSVDALLPDGTPVTFGALDDAGWQHKLKAGGAEGDVYRSLDRLIAERAEVVRRDTPAWWRRAGGYRLERLLADGGDGAASRNLASLLCGSEGTLAFATSITLGLVEKPRQTALGVVHYETRRAALEAVPSLLDTDPAAVELFDRIALHRARAVEEYRPKLHFVQGDPAALLIVEYYGESDAELAAKLDELQRAIGPSGVMTRCLVGAQIRDVWSIRKVGLGLAMSARLPVQAQAFIEDAAVPVEHLPDYITRLEGVMREAGTEAVVYAHASAGCLHVRPFLDIKRAADIAAMERIAAASADLVKEYGGILASEHGDGLARSWLAPSFYGPDLYEAYRGVKDAFDPERRFNPNRVVEAPPMTENLRYGPDYDAIPLMSDLDFGSGGFAAAVEQCNGSAVCRKRDAGTMCPSFMVTGEEKDSTRGRANALRLALSGALPPASLTGPEMKDVMDLCISCKACKSECPASVDMAALKSAWQAKLWEAGQMPLRAKLLADLPKRAQRLAGPLAPLANRMATSKPAQLALRKLGITTERALPAFARHPFGPPASLAPSDFVSGHTREAVPLDEGDSRVKLGAEGRVPQRPRARQGVVLYADTFNRYLEPDVARAAHAVLEAAGFAVVVPPYRCCGRTYLSKGVLGRAKELARDAIDTLAPYAEAGLPIVGLEPSCILTLRDEFLALLPGDARAKAVAVQAQTFEEFVAAHADTFEALPWKQAGRVLLHGHCHQKALSGIAPSVACLKTAGFEVEPVDSGCCGMAGAFGYEAEHVAVSKAMAERVLAPAVRAAAPETHVIAAGTSCRAQIADTTDREARHPAELMAAALGLVYQSE
ncbi:MAG: FAD-linked oxidase C-terminal domain-containing protein [Rhodothermales bacterium]